LQGKYEFIFSNNIFKSVGFGGVGNNIGTKASGHTQTQTDKWTDRHTDRNDVPGYVPHQDDHPQDQQLSIHRTAEHQTKLHFQ